jgi:hypothetical protein
VSAAIRSCISQFKQKAAKKTNACPGSLSLTSLTFVPLVTRHFFSIFLNGEAIAEL